MIDSIDQETLSKVRNCYEMDTNAAPNVVILEENVRFACRNDAYANPQRELMSGPEWVEAVGEWTSVTLGGERVELATLPSGRGLRAGKVACVSEDFGVTCANSNTGHGFLVRRRGVVTF